MLSMSFLCLAFLEAVVHCIFLHFAFFHLFAITTFLKSLLFCTDFRMTWNFCYVYVFFFIFRDLIKKNLQNSVKTKFENTLKHSILLSLFIVSHLLWKAFTAQLWTTSRWLMLIDVVVISSNNALFISSVSIIEGFLTNLLLHPWH